MVKKVRIIYNDDGTDEYVYEDESITFDDISKTAEDIGSSLRECGFTTRLTPLVDSLDRPGTLNPFIEELGREKNELIFNLCEAAFDESRYEMHVAALLELYGLRFTGSGPVTLGLSLDKALSKGVLRSVGIRTPGYSVFEEPPDALPGGLEFPVIIKPLREDASIGIDSDAVVRTAEELRKRVEYVIDTYYQPAIAEEFIDGREFNISVLGNGDEARTLPPAELLFDNFPEDAPKIVCYESKWITESPFYKKTVPSCPADVTAELAGELSTTALRAYRAMGCRDYARIDMRLGPDGLLRVLEVNPNPDISNDAGFARAAGAAGLDYTGLVRAIVETAWTRYEEEYWEDEDEGEDRGVSPQGV